MIGTLQKYELKKITSYIKDAETKVSPFLNKFGYSLTIEDTCLPNNRIGEYEAGSVFEKDIIVRIDSRKIRRITGKDNPYRETDVNEQIQLTVFHETGHALMEQLIDWAEYLPEAEELVNGPFGKKYFDIFNDDRIDEETIVERFANAFFDKSPSLLQNCFEEMSVLLESA